MMPGIGIVHVSIYHIKSMLSSRVQHFGCFRSMFNENSSIITRASAHEREKEHGGGGGAFLFPFL